MQVKLPGALFTIWKILKPSEPDPTEPTVKIGEAVAEIKNEGSDKKNAQSNEETGKQENVKSRADPRAT